MSFLKKYRFVIAVATLTVIYFISCLGLLLFESVSYSAPNLNDFGEYFDLYADFAQSADNEFYIKQISADDIKSADNDIRLKYVDNTAIAVAIDSASFDDVSSFLIYYDAKICGYINEVNFYQIEFVENMTLTELSSMCEALTESDIFKIVLPDYFEETPADSYKSESTIGTSEYYYEMINIPAAWKTYFKYDNDVNVGMIDVLVDYDNSHLNVVNRDKYTTVTLYNGILNGAESHGTHVAGIINASLDSDSPGMAPNADLYSYNGINTSTSYWIACICDMLLRNDVKVINISMGYNSYISVSAQLGDAEAIDYVEKENILFSSLLTNILNQDKEFVICIAAGNSTNSSLYRINSAYFGYGDKKFLEKLDVFNLFDSKPDYVDAKYSFFISDAINQDVADRIITVGSIGSDYSYTYFSNAGSVDIVAPGEYIYSTVLDNNYSYMSGTSMSAPIVSGTAAMMFTVNPELSGKEIKEIIISSATETVSEHGFTYPVLNSGEAVKSAEEKVK